ncbi:MAG: DUF6175 family protein [Fibrobacterota bacterium]
MKRIISAFSICLLAIGFCAAKDVVSNKPLSNQATFVESFSPSEWTIQATGLGGKKGFFDDMEKNALLDARKSAVQFVLTGGTDPMLNTPDAKTKFEALAEDFYKDLNVNAYISWEADKVISVVKTSLPNGDKGAKITKLFRVNREKLKAELVAKSVIVSADALASAVGNPNIMVIPETPKGISPISVLDTDPLAKHCASAIESYLTARMYEVQVPKGADQLNEMTGMLAEGKGAEEDIAYKIALSLGSDVYIVYNYNPDIKTTGKASVSVRAYETTTAKLLGTETGYSKTRMGSPAEPLLEEAINDAIDKVLQRITNYWTQDMTKGMQYKLIFKMMASFDEDKTEEIQDKVSAFAKTFTQRKENVITDKTMDYNVWAKKEQYDGSNDIYKAFRKDMKGMAKMKKISLNRKLIIVGIGEE